MKYKIKNHIIDAKSPTEALKIHKLLDSIKDNNFEEYLNHLSKFGVKYKEVPNNRSNGIAYDVSYIKYATGLEIVNTAKKFGKRIISQEPGRIVIGDSVKDSLTREEKELVDYAIDNLEHEDDADKLVKVMSIYYSEYANLARRKPNEIKEYFREVIGDSCKDSVKDAYFIVACEKGDYWFDETGKPNSFNKAKKFNSYEEADRWRRSKGEGSVQKITDATKDSEEEFIINGYRISKHYLTGRFFIYDGRGHWEDESHKGQGYKTKEEAITRAKSLPKGQAYEYEDSVKDNDLDYLTEEEERAVDDYRQAIENTTNPKLLKLYQHILEEELEHIEELTSAEVVEDACKTKDDDVKSKASKYADLIKQAIESENWQIVANDAYNLIDMLKRAKLAR